MREKLQVFRNLVVFVEASIPAADGVPRALTVACFPSMHSSCLLLLAPCRCVDVVCTYRRLWDRQASAMGVERRIRVEVKSVVFNQKPQKECGVLASPNWNPMPW